VGLNEKDAILEAAHEELSYKRWSFVSLSLDFSIRLLQRTCVRLSI
jgi:hypothetical protein